MRVGHECRWCKASSIYIVNDPKRPDLPLINRERQSDPFHVEYCQDCGVLRLTDWVLEALNSDR